MKKTLIAAAVAAAVAAPAANAGVVIYGQLHIALDYLDADLSTSGVSKVWEVNSRTSRIGFKGSEDLGNGLKAIWKLENTVRITDTGSTFGSHNGARGHWGSARNAYVGLASDWGTVLVGRHDTPYKMAFYSTGIDMLGVSIIDANSMYGIVEVRADNAIAYVSPNMNGLTIAAAIVPGEGYTNPVTGETFDGLADNYSISAMYSNNGLKLAVGYESLDQGLPATAFGGTVPGLCATAALTPGDCTNTMVGAGYSMNGFDVSGEPPYAYSLVWVDRSWSFAGIAEATGLTVEVLRELNPHLVADRTPMGGGPYPLRVPEGSSIRVASRLARPDRAYAMADD